MPHMSTMSRENEPKIESFSTLCLSTINAEDAPIGGPEEAIRLLSGAAKFFCHMRRYYPYTSCAPFPDCLRLSKRRRSSKRSSTRNADRPAEMPSKASVETTSVILVNKDLSFPLGP